MFQCNAHGSCHGCCHGFDRRRFLQGCATATVGAAGSLAPWSGASAAEPGGDKVRVAVVFLAQVRNSWPYPGFDAAGRQREILAALRRGCPGVEFVPVTVRTTGDAGKALELKDQVDAYLVYVAT